MLLYKSTLSHVPQVPLYTRHSKVFKPGAKPVTVACGSVVSEKRIVPPATFTQVPDAVTGVLAPKVAASPQIFNWSGPASAPTVGKMLLISTSSQDSQVPIVKVHLNVLLPAVKFVTGVLYCVVFAIVLKPKIRVQRPVEPGYIAGSVPCKVTMLEHKAGLSGPAVMFT